MHRIVAGLGCIGLLVVVAAVVALGAAHGRWGAVALVAAVVVLLLARIAAGGERG